MSNYIILKQLSPKPRMILKNGIVSEKIMSAFLGATDETNASFGIGLIDEQGGNTFWGLIGPHCLVTAWRGVQVLDQVLNIKDGTICACYYTGERELSGRDERYLDILREQMFDIDQIRAELLEVAIPSEELDSMLSICNSKKNGISVLTCELEDEINAETIMRTEQVELAFKISQQRYDFRENNRKFSKTPLSKDKSFAQFFKDFRIVHLTDAFYGTSDMDWGYIKMESIDERIIFDGLQFNHANLIFCSSESAKSHIHGYFGHPVLGTNDGRNVVLSSVVYKDDESYAVVNNVGETETSELKLSDFRKLEPLMIGLTFTKYDHVSEEDTKRGFVLIQRENKSFFNRLLGK